MLCYNSHLVWPLCAAQGACGGKQCISLSGPNGHRPPRHGQVTSEPSPHAPCPPDQSLRRIHTGLNPLCPHGVPIWVGGGDRRQPTAAPGKGVGPEHPREVRTQRGLAEDAVSQGQWRQGPPPVLGSTALQEEDQSGAVGAGGSGRGERCSCLEPQHRVG